MLKVNHISKSYHSIEALKDIDITFNKGEIIGLLGVNGAGKSTLLKILAAILTPDQGCVLYDGKDCLENLFCYREKLGYLSEDNPLYENMYVREYLNYIADIYRIDRKIVPSVLSQLGLVNEERKKISTLSRGNKQRVGMAQALLHDPEILILDEATSGLDVIQRESLLKLLSCLSKDRIIIFSTHIMQDVKALCSRIILVHQGRIMADDSINNIESIEKMFHQLADENNC